MIWPVLVAFGVVVAIVAYACWREDQPAEPEPERPGDDEQWADLVDALARFRKHRQRERRHA